MDSEKLIMHEKYDPKAYNYDIGLVKLKDVMQKLGTYFCLYSSK